MTLLDAVRELNRRRELESRLSTFTDGLEALRDIVPLYTTMSNSLLFLLSQRGYKPLNVNPVDIGDCVQLMCVDKRLNGKQGMIVEIKANGLHVVEFPKPIEGGHNCGGNTKDGRGRYAERGELVKVLIAESVESLVTYQRFCAGLRTEMERYKGFIERPFQPGEEVQVEQPGRLHHGKKGIVNQLAAGSVYVNMYDDKGYTTDLLTPWNNKYLCHVQPLDTGTIFDDVRSQVEKEHRLEEYLRRREQLFTSVLPSLQDYMEDTEIEDIIKKYIPDLPEVGDGDA